jgi:hypothetical protein
MTQDYTLWGSRVMKIRPAGTFWGNRTTASAGSAGCERRLTGTDGTGMSAWRRLKKNRKQRTYGDSRGVLSKVGENGYDTIVAHEALSGPSDLQKPARIELPAYSLTPIRSGNPQRGEGPHGPMERRLSYWTNRAEGCGARSATEVRQALAGGNAGGNGEVSARRLQYSIRHDRDSSSS